MQYNTRSRLNLEAFPISSLQYEVSPCARRNQHTSGRQVTNMSFTESKQESQSDWQSFRDEESHMLRSIKKLKEEEWLDVDQWLAGVHKMFEELHYPMLHRVAQTVTYLQDEEIAWYNQVKNEINNDWPIFCDRLKQHIQDQCKDQLYSSSEQQQEQKFVQKLSSNKSVMNKFVKYSGTGNADEWLLQTIRQFTHFDVPRSEQFECIPLLLEDKAYIWYMKQDGRITNIDTFCKQFLQQFSTLAQTTSLIDSHKSSNEITSSSIATVAESSMSKLQQTIAVEIIKKPTYFRGSKDDVQEWLNKLEHRFDMAKWTDEQKLQYISVHLIDDAYQWWSQVSTTINSWQMFVETIKKAYGSSETNETAFEQLKWYKQSMSQTVTQYYTKTMELCKKVDPVMTDAMKLKYLLAGVKHSLKLHISLSDPKTTEAFLSFARKVEDTLRLTGKDNEIIDTNANASAVTSTKPTLQPANIPQSNRNYRENDTRQLHGYTQPTYYNNRDQRQSIPHNNRPQQTPRNRTNVICYSCGTPGHYSRDCTGSHFQ